MASQVRPRSLTAPPPRLRPSISVRAIASRVLPPTTPEWLTVRPPLMYAVGRVADGRDRGDRLGEGRGGGPGELLDDALLGLA